MKKEYTARDKKETLLRVLAYSKEQAEERLKFVQEQKRKNKGKYYCGQNKTRPENYHYYAPWEGENMWLKMKLNGHQKDLEYFLETTYKFVK